MIVDIHVHPVVDEKTFGHMLREAEAAGIDKLVVLGALQRTYYEDGKRAVDDHNTKMEKVMEKYSGSIVGFCNVGCTDPDATWFLEKSVREFGMRGLGELGYERHWDLKGLLGCHLLLRKAGELGIPVVIHSWHTEEGLPPHLEEHVGNQPRHSAHVIGEIARRCPDTTLIFSHVGGIWEKAFQAAKPYQNACFDTSGFDPLMGVVERAVQVLGSERVFFGSDAPGRSFVAQVAKVQYADISKRDRDMILGGNAMRVLGLR